MILLLKSKETSAPELKAFAENLEGNVTYVRNTTTGEFSGSFPASLGLLAPRTYGVRVGFHWGRSGS